MKTILIFAALAVLSASASARDIRYVGGDRYVCSGSGCESFDARERNFQAQREQAAEQRRYNEEARSRRERQPSYESGSSYSSSGATSDAPFGSSRW